MEPKKLPTYFISHGGGPWPWLKQEMPFYDQLEGSLKDMPRQLGVTPKAVLMISAHWEDADFAVMTSPKPPMLYDYSGFPDRTYQINYPAPGDPALARRVGSLLEAAGLPTREDATRGFDHGMFAPMFAMYPNAEVPVVQLSIRHDYDPETHLAAGRALAPLRDEGILIVGSGLSYHNLRSLMRRDPAAGIASRAFDAWLQKTLLDSTPAARTQALLEWESAPSARAAHPQEDHLIPLMVAIGAAETDDASLVYHEDAFMGTVAASSFRFDTPRA